MIWLTSALAFTLGFATHWGYSELSRWRRYRDTDRRVAEYWRAEQRVASGVREMQRND